MASVERYSHRGWDDYYRAQAGNRAWSGAPDEFLIQHVNELLVKGAQSVLDIAAGDGRNSEPFLGRGLSVVSTDLSAAALHTFGRRCAAGNMQQPVLIAGDFLALDFVTDQFDCAVCFNSVPHFESPAGCLQKISALLKPGGRAMFNAFTPGDVAFGQGEMVAENAFYYKETLFRFLREEEVVAMLPATVDTVLVETRRWQEQDHGDYRRGAHMHEACYFIIEKKTCLVD